MFVAGAKQHAIIINPKVLQFFCVKLDFFSLLINPLSNKSLRHTHTHTHTHTNTFVYDLFNSALKAKL